jgi:hypothetical protein
MPYVGNKPEVGNFRKCDAITTSATATYNLLVGGVAVNPNQNQCIVSLNGVIQSSGNSYTIASSQITFASALTSSDVIDFILILGDTLDVGVPSDDTVDASKITANVITGQSALGATPADTDELLISDAGTLKRVDYSYLKSSVVNRPNAQPLIINGDMAVAQRGTSSTGLTSSSYNTVDRFKTNISGLGTWTETQESLTSGNAYTDGFSNAFKIDCTTADASPAASDRLYWTYRFEGQDVQLLKKGTANAEKVTVSFWIKATKTGTNILELYDNDNSRQVSASYTISSSDTWEHKVVSFPADTSGVLGDDNGSSLFIVWALGAGSNYTSGTLNTSWASNTNANRYVGQVNHGDSTSNNVHITGVQMEVGEYTSSTLPPFQHESYGDNLARCQRYFYKIGGAYKGLCIAWTPSGTEVATELNFPVTMRSTPSVTVDASNFEFRRSNNSAYTLTDDTPAMSFVTPEGGSMWFTEGSVGNSSGTNVGVVRSISSANDHFKFSSEL